jgi:hypothetical protein
MDSNVCVFKLCLDITRVELAQFRFTDWRYAAGLSRDRERPWSFPFDLVRKKNGVLRFCVYYRKLNYVGKEICFQMPGIDDTLCTLAGAKWLSILDLKTQGRQGENCILDPSKFVAIYSHERCPLQRSGDIPESNGNSSARSDVRFISYVLRRCDIN